jgi:hypothetical protein
VVGLAQVQPTASQSGEHTDGNSSRIETKFDSTKNQTTVELKGQIIGTATEKLWISVDGTYATQTPKKHPEDVVFIISAMNKTGYRFPDINSLIITIDGKRLGPVLLLNLDKRASGEDYLETLGTRMKYDVFMQLVKGKKAEKQFGKLSFELDEQQLAKLKQVADLLHL